ncbi:MAG: metallophosphoesterase [Kiritimatiellae bacterium]|nr:metallophosphoesterase [Kiritimatiellia bacterium]
MAHRFIWLAALAGITLGVFSLFLDLCNRTFGRYYPRKFAGTLLRVVLITLAPLPLTVPLFVLAAGVTPWIGWGLLLVAATAGYGIFIHFLFPFRAGVAQVPGYDAGDVVTTLDVGVILRETVVRTEALPAGKELSFLVLSDLHCNRSKRLELIRRSFEGVRKTGLVPDAVFVLGDLTERRRFIEPVVKELSGLPNRYGIYCVRGNHGFEDGRNDLMEAAFRANGMILLANDVRALPELGVTLVGSERPWNAAPFPPVPPGGGLVVGLAHTPDNISLFRALNVDLGLAGHTHGGGIHLPLIGPLLVPVSRGRFLRKGLFRHGKMLLYVTVGIGHYPGERGYRGEIVRLRVRPAHAAARAV